MTTIPDLIARLVEMNDGNAAQAARQLGASTASLSRYRSGEAAPRKSLETRLRSIVAGQPDLLEPPAMAETNTRLLQLEGVISGTLDALREEFHRTATVTRRQDVLDLVAALFFAHVTSVEAEGPGLGRHLLAGGSTAVAALSAFLESAFTTYLPAIGDRHGRYFTPLFAADERFAQAVLDIFDRDAAAFRGLHAAGRNDLINEVFSRFMSASFVDEKEMGQYLTPPEVTRFMVQMGFHALSTDMQDGLLSAQGRADSGCVLDPSCGVGSFLAEAIRYFHELARERDPDRAAQWLSGFVGGNVVGIDKSERMMRLACINMSLFGNRIDNFHLANGLAREGLDAATTNALEGRSHLILTNPPFGATYGDSDIAAFAMGRGRSWVDSEILFLERYLDWAAQGAVIASVVPDSILVNQRQFARLRNLLASCCEIVAVVSLPPQTFAAAGTSTKTSVLVLRRTDRPGRVPTFFGEAREVGYDVVTRSGQRRRVHHARNDLPALLAEFRGEAPLRLGQRAMLPENASRWDAGFHAHSDAHRRLESRAENACVVVSEVAALIDERADPRRGSAAEFDYIEISDVDARSGLVGHKRLSAEAAPGRARKVVRAGDVLVSTVRPERGAVGVVPPHLDGAICSTGFAVLRPQAIHPVALAWLMKSESVRAQMVRHNIGIAYPAIAEATCLSLVLPLDRGELDRLAGPASALDSAQAAFEAARSEMIRLTSRSG